MADKEGTRKTEMAVVVCACPDVCLTPGGGPVPYLIFAYCNVCAYCYTFASPR